MEARRGSDADAARVSPPLGKHMLAAPLPSSATGALPALPSSRARDSAVSPVASAPFAGPRSMSSTLVGICALPSATSVVSPSEHSRLSFSTAVPAMPLVGRPTAPLLPPFPVVQRAPDLPTNAASFQGHLCPSLPTTVALAPPSLVEGICSTGGAVSAASGNLPHAVTSLDSAPSAPATSVAVSLQQPRTESAAPPSLVDDPVLAAAVPTASLPVTYRYQRRPCRKHRILESAALDLFSSRSVSDSHTSRSSRTLSRPDSVDCCSSDSESVFVGRTRRIGDPHNRENQRQRRGGAEAEAAALRASSRKRRQRHSSRGAVRKGSGPTVLRIYEVAGRSRLSFSASREKTLMSSQSTDALTQSRDAKSRNGDGTGRHAREGENATVTDAAGVGDAARIAVTGSSTSPNVVDGAEAPLLFTSPAVRMQAKYQSSTKSKGPKQGEASWLTRNALLGTADEGGRHESDRSDDRIAADDDDMDGDASEEGRVQFRATGAFKSEYQFTRLCHADRSGAHGGREGQRADSTRSSQVAGGGACEEPDAVVALTIRGMSPLHADVDVVHPFVRVWVVSCVSGRNLVEASDSVPCAITHPFDLRAHKTRAPWWYAQVALRLSPERMRMDAGDAMLLLEVLDFGSETIHGFPLYRQGLYPVCWGFLMLRECAGHSNLCAADDLHVQLYRYPSRTPWYLSWLSALLPKAWSAPGAAVEPQGLAVASRHNGGGPSASIVDDVPSIFRVFADANNRKIPYDGCIVLRLRLASSTTLVTDSTDMLAYEEYLLSMLAAGGGSCAVPRSSRSAAGAARDESSLSVMMGEGGLRGAAVPASPWSTVLPTENYYRMDGERSLLPHEILRTTEVQGVVTCVSFAHSGSLLALGVCRHLQHVVELRNPLLPDVAAVACLIGHTGHIYCVVFQKEDNYVLSCSSDGTVRVWQLRLFGGILTTEARAEPGSVQCVCTLPHGFPVYTAVFHQERIISGGFSDQLFVWDYEDEIEGETESVTATENTTLPLTATFTPAFDATTRFADSLRSTGAVLGQLVHRVDVADAAVARKCGSAMTVSLASNERSNRVWSVHAKGCVVCWRATRETANRGGGGGSRLWQMSVRHTAECDGAVEVQVNAAYAIVTCGSAPFVFVFDATTCEQLRVVNTRLPFATPICLLPDGEAFVAGVSDPCRLLAWECFDGGLCTSASGYGKASPLFSVARMAWAESQQLAVFVSRSPCSEVEMVRYKQGPVAPAAGQSTAAFHYWHQKLQYQQSDVPAERTLITVAGTARRKSTVILTTDARCSDAFVMMFGGDLQSKRKAAFLAKRTHAIRQRAAERDTRNARLHPTLTASEPSALFETSAIASIPYDATEKGARMNAIVNFWRGLVSQHRHAKAHRDLADGAPSRADASGTLHATPRALQYAEDDA
ncbi:hypothetical protein CUR178_02219 [Leishmania enriettii]|uniref:Uncharacterized protein n=1 Tax=Leishmania enriettii TaxID=5663 RepID=A0A836GW65_LEIEN|nr:hypothetical protein CUR178_02219 [Leishmania enriettii]